MGTDGRPSACRTGPVARACRRRHARGLAADAVSLLLAHADAYAHGHAHDGTPAPAASLLGCPARLAIVIVGIPGCRARAAPRRPRGVPLRASVPLPRSRGANGACIVAATIGGSPACARARAPAIVAVDCYEGSRKYRGYCHK